MTTRRTDELCPGDRVQTQYGVRTVKEVLEQVTDFGTHFVSWEKEWYPAPKGEWCAGSHSWHMGPSTELDLAVQRAQELADQYPHGGSFLISNQLRDFSRLLALFRAAR